MQSSIDIENEYLEIIKDILKNYLPKNSKAFVFGSRAKIGKARKFSDVDIAIDANSPLDFGLISMIKNDFSESMIPYFIDIIDFNSISEEFKECIKPDLIRII